MSYEDYYGRYSDIPEEWGEDVSIDASIPQLVLDMIDYGAEVLLYDYTSTTIIPNRIGDQEEADLVGDTSNVNDPPFFNVLTEWGATVHSAGGIYADFVGNYPTFDDAEGSHTLAALRTYAGGTRYAFDTNDASGASVRMYMGSGASGPQAILGGVTVNSGDGVNYATQVAPVTVTQDNPEAASLFTAYLDATVPSVEVWADQYKLAEQTVGVTGGQTIPAGASAHIGARFDGGSALGAGERQGFFFHANRLISGDERQAFIQKILGRNVWTDQPYYDVTVPGSQSIALRHHLPFWDRNAENSGFYSDLGGAGAQPIAGQCRAAVPDIPATRWHLRSSFLRSPDQIQLADRGLDWSVGFTITGWFRVDIPAGRGFVGAQDGAGQGWYSRTEADGVEVFTNDGANALSAKATFTVDPSLWYFFSLVVQGGGDNLTIRVVDEFGTVVGTANNSGAGVSMTSFTDGMEMNGVTNFFNAGWHSFAGWRVYENAPLSIIDLFRLPPDSYSPASAPTDLEVVQETATSITRGINAELNNTGEVIEVDDATPFGINAKGGTGVTVDDDNNFVFTALNGDLRLDDLSDLNNGPRSFSFLAALVLAEQGPVYSIQTSDGSSILLLVRLNGSLQFEIVVDDTLEYTSGTIGNKPTNITIGLYVDREGTLNFWINGALDFSGSVPLAAFNLLGSEIHSLGGVYNTGPTLNQQFVGSVAELQTNLRNYTTAQVNAWHTYANDTYGLGL